MSDASTPPSITESQLTRAEAEFSAREQRLHERLSETREEGRKLAEQLAALKERLESSLLSGAPDVLVELEALSVPALEEGPERARALELRQQSLALRQELAETLERRVQAGDALLDQLRTATRQKAEWLASEERIEREHQEQARREAERQAEEEAQAKAEAWAREAAAQAHETMEEGVERTGAEPALADTFISATPGKAPPLPPAARELGRQRERHSLQTAIDLRSDSNFFTGFSTNLSEGGVFLATYQELEPGTEVELTLTLPGQPGLRVSGTVKWTRELSEREPDLTPGLGIQFNALEAESLDAIRSFVKGRDPLFYPD